MTGIRLEKLRGWMDGEGIDSLIVVHPANVRYLTGFDGDAGWLAVGATGAFLVTSPMFSEQAAALTPPVEPVIATESFTSALAAFDPAFWGARTGYEAEHLTCTQFGKLRSALPASGLVPAGGGVETLRIAKTPDEIDAIVRAQKITERVFGEVLELVRPGITERDLALEIEYRFGKYGGERAAFPSIVASGPNTSLPHAVPTGRALTSGDFVLFDLGTVVDGYASDMSRTVVLGRASSEQRRIYGLVRESLHAARDMIAAGVSCSAAHRTAQAVFERAGVADRFLHSLGHGVGLEVHEAPRLSLRSDETIREHAVVTVEPGLYIPGFGGVRIEDMVEAVTGGCHMLTMADDELMEL